MRRDFRVKLDFSRIYQDARQHSWVYIDSTKIFYVNQLAEHVQKLFDIKKPFHLLSKYQEMCVFLPFEEDVRVLESNDTVLIVPGTGIINGCEGNNTGESSQSTQNGFQQNDFLVPPKYKEKKRNASPESTCVSDKSSIQTIEIDETTISGNSLTNSLYCTALHELAMDTQGDDDSKSSKMMEDTLNEDNSINNDLSPISNKRKRVRKRKSKKNADVVPESDTSLVESSGKKPKIIDSVLISSGKHIRFQGLDDDTASDSNIINESNIPRVIQNGHNKNKQLINKDLSALLNLRQSSTPLTFAHKRIKKEYQTEKIEEHKSSAETSEAGSRSNSNLYLSESTTVSERNKENSQTNKSNTEHDTVSFRVFRMAEDYTPQLSSVIIAQVLSHSPDDSQYTLKILHGKEQLQDPDGKFSLPKDEEEENDQTNDIITLETSKLLELTKVKSI